MPFESKAWSFYKERCGDYLLVRKKPHARRTECHEALSAQVEGNPRSIEWTLVSKRYIDEECEPIEEALVPETWLDWFDERWEAA